MKLVPNIGARKYITQYSAIFLHASVNVIQLCT